MPGWGRPPNLLQPGVQDANPRPGPPGKDPEPEPKASRPEISELMRDLFMKQKQNHTTELHSTHLILMKGLLL